LQNRSISSIIYLCFIERGGKEMVKKIKGVLAFILMVVITLNNVQASSSDFINIGIFEKAFVSSSVKAEKLLPFINVFSESAIYDTKISSSGMSMSSKSITIDNEIKGSQIILASDTVTVNGEVEYAKIMATNVVINGKIKKDTIIIANSVFVTEKGSIENDAIILSSKVEIRGKIEGSLIGNIGDLYVSGTIGRDVRASVTSFEFKNENISGDIFLQTDADTKDLLEKYPQATIKSIEKQEGSKVKKQESLYKILTKGLLQVVIYSLIYVIITKKPNNFVNKLSKKVKQNLPLTSFIGIAMIFAIPMILFLLFVAGMVGFASFAWPAMIAYITITILVFMTSQFIVGIVVSSFVLEKNKEENVGMRLFSKTFLVFASIYIISVVPYVKEYASIIYVLFASGIVFTGIFKKYKDINPQDKIEDTKNEENKDV